MGPRGSSWVLVAPHDDDDDDDGDGDDDDDDEHYMSYICRIIMTLI